MNSKTIQFVSIISIVVLAFLMGVATIQLKQDIVVSAQEHTAVSASVSPLLQYQGRLSDPDSGQPVADGSYTMTFRLYSTSSGGTALWVETKDVPVKGGLFSTLLGDTKPLAQNLFTGQALWLGIKVGADEEATPRQQIVPVAYALSLVPGASIHAANSTAALNLTNTGSGAALHAGGPVRVDGDLNVAGSLIGGSHKHANYVDWYSFDDHIYVSNAHHDRYSDAEAVSAILAADGSGSGLDADKLDGQQAGAFATVDHSHAMLPIAYGIIHPDGSVISATSNVSSWSFPCGQNCYEIAISGHYYEPSSYVTLITPEAVELDPRDGKMRVVFPCTSVVCTYGPRWQFVIFKP